MGGTGHTFDWSLIRALNTERKLILAGGLRPDNVADSVREVRPFGIDTASGVEDSPRKKSAQKVAEFISAARRADLLG
jgi:phosphoribosylanthranilate isomerase